MVPHRRVIRLKGGPGSGHRGHRGRPGLRGGSAPGAGGARDVVADWSEVPQDVHDRVFGDMTREQVEDMFILKGARLEAKLSHGGGDIEYIDITGKWYMPDGTRIGQFHRVFGVMNDGTKIARNSALVFDSGFQGRGFATSLYDRQIGQLRKAGFDRIELSADISIGRYAWAKKGFDYRYERYGKADPEARAARASKDFLIWAVNHNLTTPGSRGPVRLLSGDEWPTFKTANDVATYKIPGVKLRGKDITNFDVPQGMSLDLGKAFMLDRGSNGHGSWDAELKL